MYKEVFPMVQGPIEQTNQQNEPSITNPLINISHFIFATFGIELTVGFLEYAASVGVESMLDHWAGGLLDPVISIHALSTGLKSLTSRETQDGKLRPGLFINQSDIDLRDDDECLFKRVVNISGQVRRSSYAPVVLIHSKNAFNKYYCIVGLNDNILSITKGHNSVIYNITREEAVQQFIHADGEYDDRLLAFNYVCRLRANDPLLQEPY